MTVVTVACTLKTIVICVASLSIFIYNLYTFTVEAKNVNISHVWFGKRLSDLDVQKTTSGLVHRYVNRLEKFTLDKRSSLFCRSVSDEEKKFYNIDVRFRDPDLRAMFGVSRFTFF